MNFITVDKNSIGYVIRGEYKGYDLGYMVYNGYTLKQAIQKYRQAKNIGGKHFTILKLYE